MTGRGQHLSVDPSSADAPAPPSSPATPSEIIAAHRLAKDCLILFGCAQGAVAAEGPATIAANGSECGRFRAISWPDVQAAPKNWFVAALRVVERNELQPGENLLLQAAGSRASIPVALPPLLADAVSFAAALHAHARNKLDDVARFLLETFSSRASRQLPNVSAFLAAILDCASEEDGLIETLGVIDGEGLMLQGWLGHQLGGRQRLLWLGAALDEHEAVCANFARADLAGRGVGMVMLVRPKNGGVPEMPRKIYLQAGDRFCRLNVPPDATRLPDDQAANHLRSLLPSLQAEGNLQRQLGAAARSHYSGIDTVSGLDRPVRMVVDLAASIPGAGFYLVGWLLDPKNLVSAVHVRGRNGLSERIDRGWTRVLREDVTASLRTDPLFQGLIATDLHGFTAFVPYQGAESEIWLELHFADGLEAFMPLRVVSGEGAGGRTRLLESFDLTKPSAPSIVERHLGPLFHAAKSAPKRKPSYRVFRDRGADVPLPSAALIIPITASEPKTKLVVAQLASRDPGNGVVPVFVCSAELGDGINALSRELGFYGLDALVLLSEEPVSICEALEIGVHATQAEKLVFMLPSTYPLHAHWASQLGSLLDHDGGPVVASPTLLYEDWSISYGGIDAVRFLDAAPYVDAASSRAGYPRESMPESGVTPTLAAALDCCAMRRSTFEQVGGFGGGYTLAPLAGLDLFLRLREAGTRMIWVPQIEAYTLGDSAAQSAYSDRTGALVDGWSLRAGWKDRLPPVVGLPRSNAAAESGQARADNTVARRAVGMRGG